MKKFVLIAALCCALGLSSFTEAAAQKYEDYFTPDRLRVDLVFAGNARQQGVWLESLNFEQGWSGTREHLVPPFDYGEYRIDLYEGDVLIFSSGFSSLFFEWRTTPEAVTEDRAFCQSVRIPMPARPVTMTVSSRSFDTGKFVEMKSFAIDPSDLSINREKANDWKVGCIQYNGPVGNKVDLVFIAEGYTREQMPKFLSDVRRMTDYLFSMEPYRSRRSDFNVWAVESESADPGPDIPHEGVWNNTVACSTFYTFHTDRYLTSPNHKTVAQLACNAPCDAMYVLVNTDKYGGGGIYGFYGLCASDARFNREVFIHELGHSFAGLGDEYFDSETAYNDMYNLKIENWEPNITTRVDFASKWQDMVGVRGVGLFEGGGYSAKGIWRPREDCRMKTNTAEDFCPVCQRAINLMIDYYCK